MHAKKLKKISFEEYVAIEKATGIKHEYHDGLIYAMAGGTINHGLICGNIFGELRNEIRAKNQNCVTINSEVKLYLDAKESFVYPDAMVICEEIEKSKVTKDAVTNPTIIVEVLSKSTAAYDRGGKFHMYRKIKSLKEYIIIEQDKAIVDIYSRRGDLWHIAQVIGLEAQLFIESIGVKIDLKEIYQDVDFPTEKEDIIQN